MIVDLQTEKEDTRNIISSILFSLKLLGGEPAVQKFRSCFPDIVGLVSCVRNEGGVPGFSMTVTMKNPLRREGSSHDTLAAVFTPTTTPIVFTVSPIPQSINCAAALWSDNDFTSISMEGWDEIEVCEVMAQLELDDCKEVGSDFNFDVSDSMVFDPEPERKVSFYRQKSEL